MKLLSKVFLTSAFAIFSQVGWAQFGHDPYYPDQPQAPYPGTSQGGHLGHDHDHGGSDYRLVSQLQDALNKVSRADEQLHRGNQRQAESTLRSVYHDLRRLERDVERTGNYAAAQHVNEAMRLLSDRNMNVHRVIGEVQTNLRHAISDLDQRPGPRPRPNPRPYPQPQPNPYPNPYPQPGPYPQPQPVYADMLCYSNIGGNIFRPKTNFDCNVTGFGAVRYEILVDGRVMWRGVLNPGVRQQKVETEKLVVGGRNVRYDLILTLQNGRRLPGQIVHQR